MRLRRGPPAWGRTSELGPVSPSSSAARGRQRGPAHARQPLPRCPRGAVCVLTCRGPQPPSCPRRGSPHSDLGRPAPVAFCGRPAPRRRRSGNCRICRPAGRTRRSTSAAGPGTRCWPPWCTGRRRGECRWCIRSEAGRGVPPLCFARGGRRRRQRQPPRWPQGCGSHIAACDPCPGTARRCYSFLVLGRGEHCSTFCGPLGGWPLLLRGASELRPPWTAPLSRPCFVRGCSNGPRMSCRVCPAPWMVRPRLLRDGFVDDGLLPHGGGGTRRNAWSCCSRRSVR